MLPNQSIYRISPTGDSHSTVLNDIDTRNLQSVRIGESAGTISRGSHNVFAGVGAGTQNTTGSYQTMIGYYAGNAAQNANYSVGIGAYALAQNQGGIENVIIGYRGGEFHLSGSRIVSVGAYSGRYNYSGDGNVNVGYASGERNIEGNYNAWVGTEAGQNNRSGSFNTGVGYQAGRASFMANENVYIGAYSGACNAFGNQNTFIGYSSGEYNQNGSYNTYVGAYTGAYASFGDANTALGFNAGVNNSTGSSNVWIGVSASENTHEATGNVVIGVDAAKNIADGGYNVVIGLEAAKDSSGAERNVVIGAYSAQTVQGDGNTVIGYHTGSRLTSGNLNTLIGIGAELYDGSNSSSIVIGPALLYGGTDSILIGSNITDERMINILIGNIINANAEFIVAIGNDLNIDDNIIFRDQLFRGYVNAAAQDGDVKFAIVIDTSFNPPGYSNTTYTNTIVSPSNINYTYATAALFTSNIYNSAVPANTPIQQNYLLIAQTPHYLLQNGKTLPILTIGVPTWNNTNIATDINHNLSSLTISNPNYSSYLYTHEFDSTLTYNQSDVVTNIYGSNTSSSIYKVYVPKRVKQYQFQSNNYFVPFQANYLPTSNWSINGNGTGIELGNNKYYYVSQQPSFGVLDHPYYPSDTSNVLYSPFIECLNTPTDTFKISPNQVIIDNENKVYGRLSSSNSVNVSFSNTVLVPNTLVFSPLRSINSNQLSIPFSLSNFWIAPLQLSGNTPISITSFDSNITLTLLGSNYTIGNSIPTFHYSNILRQDLILSAYSSCNIVEPTYFNIQSNLYGVSNIILQEPNALNYTAPAIVNTVTPAFQTNNFSLSSASRILIYPPTNGYIPSQTSSILPSSISYRLIDPFNTDSFVVGYTDASGLSNLSTQYTIQPPSGTSIYPILWQTSNLHPNTIYDSSSNIYQTFIEQTQDIYNSITTSNNGVQTSSVQQPIIYYDPMNGYSIATSNLWYYPSQSNWNPDGTPGNYTCNIIYQYESSNFTYNSIQHTAVLDIGIWNTQHSYSSVSYEENSNYIYPVQINVLNSNLAAYDSYNWYYTSNINVFETRVNGSLYTQSIVNETISPILLSNLLVPTTGAYQQTSNIHNNLVIERYYVSYYNDLILHRQNLFTYPNNTSYSITQNNSPIRFMKNKNMINTFSQTEINQNEIHLLIPSFSNTSNFNVILNNSITLPIITTASTYYSSNYSTLTLPLGNNPSINFKSIVSSDPEWTNTAYTRIVIQDIENGSIVLNQRQLLFNKTDIQADSVSYVAKYSVKTDSITYFYTNVDYSQTSTKYMKHLYLNRSGMPYGQSINKAPTPYNVLDPTIFALNYTSNVLKIEVDTANLPNLVEMVYNNTVYDNSVSTILQITYLETVRFQLKNTYNGNPTITNFIYNVLDISNNVLVSGATYPLTLYNQYLFPFGSNGTLYLQKLGTSSYQNYLTPTLYYHLSNIHTPVDIFVLNPPQKGILYNSGIVSKFTLDEINSLRYISLNPSRIENDSMTVQFAYSNVISYPYSLTIKNYFAPYKPTVVDPTKDSILGRTLPLSSLYLSQGLIQDGYSWVSSNNTVSYNPYPTTSCNITFTLSNSSAILYSYEVAVNTLPYSTSATFKVPNMSIYVEQANRVSLSSLLQYTAFDLSQSQNVWYYLIQHPLLSPPTGIITDLYGVAKSRFSYIDLLNSNVYYQHIGSTATDSFTIGLSSTPYDIDTGHLLTVAVVVSYLKRIEQNPIHYLYHDTIQSAITANHTLKPFSFEEDTTSYIHVLSTSNVSVSTSLFTPNDVLNDTVSLSVTNPTSNYFGFDFVYNNSVAVNPLTYHPLYQNLFIKQWSARLNEVIHQNIYQGTVQNPQSIQYLFNSSNIHYANLNTNQISFEFVLRPRQSLYYETLSTNPSIYPDWNVINQHLESLIRTYRFNIVLKNIYDETMLWIELTDTTIFIQTLTQSITIPVITKLSFTDFTTIRYINIDIDNDNNVSLFINNVNLLQGYDILPIAFNTLQGLSISFDIYDPKNIYNFNSIISYGNLPYHYNFLNFGNIFEINNFLMSTIRQIADTNTYNVVLGKTINLEGTNNIYLGNNFNTIGDNSIIVGNFIGGTATDTANDIYQSILVGNNFFQNFSFIRNMICIGNNVLNDATTFDPATLANFFNSYPIFIGNNITNDDIEYQINIGKVFLKNVPGDKILIGRSEEYVGIGYLDDTWTPLAQLMVHGGIYTDTAVVSNTITTSNLNTFGVTVNNNYSGSNGILNRLENDGSCLYFTHSGNGQQLMDAIMFYRRTNTLSGIGATATNPFGVSPYIQANLFYEFEYIVLVTNSGTGSVSVGWGGTNLGTGFINAVLENHLNNNNIGLTKNVSSATTTTNKIIAGVNTAAPYYISIRGSIVSQTAQRLPLQVSVASGSLTIGIGSYFKFMNRGSQSTIGNIA